MRVFTCDVCVQTLQVCTAGCQLAVDIYTQRVSGETFLLLTLNNLFIFSQTVYSCKPGFSVGRL